jgi:hypothetical protein
LGVVQHRHRLLQWGPPEGLAAGGEDQGAHLDRLPPPDLLDRAPTLEMGDADRVEDVAAVRVAGHVAPLKHRHVETRIDEGAGAGGPGDAGADDRDPGRAHAAGRGSASARRSVPLRRASATKG